MASQTRTGKAFEYALLQELYERLHTLTTTRIIENTPYKTAKQYFDNFDADAQDAYRITSSAAINFLIDVEPRLSHAAGLDDILELEIVADARGQVGDVRDILTVRSQQSWEIGISAKNNHRAVKHPRLSPKIDFGQKWLGLPCSERYFDEIAPTFNMLADVRNNDKTAKWDAVGDVGLDVYKPVLDAFRAELMRLNEAHPLELSRRLLAYLIGEYDFYKVIRQRGKVEIQAYNLHGSLNQGFKRVKPKAKIPILKLPNRLIEAVYKDNSHTTLIVSLDEGWQIAFRLHSAKSTVEPSLKFDINLLSTPYTLFATHLFVSN